MLKIKFGHIRVDSMNKNSGVFIGENRALHWRSHNKNQSAIGDPSDSEVSRVVAIVSDNDAIDFWVKGKKKPGIKAKKRRRSLIRKRRARTTRKNTALYRAQTAKRPPLIYGAFSPASPTGRR